jgi:hypothetical protein
MTSLSSRADSRLPAIGARPVSHCDASRRPQQRTTEALQWGSTIVPKRSNPA